MIGCLGINIYRARAGRQVGAALSLRLTHIGLTDWSKQRPIMYMVTYKAKFQLFIGLLWLAGASF